MQDVGSRRHVDAARHHRHLAFYFGRLGYRNWLRFHERKQIAHERAVEALPSIVDEIARDAIQAARVRNARNS